MTRFFGRETKVMVLGTAGINDEGELFLSKLAEQRAHQVAEVFYNQSFDRNNGRILVAGGYSKELKDKPPIQREAYLIGEYLMRQYSIPERALLLEDESTTTVENFTLSLERYPDFFADVIDGKRRLGLVSHRDHLKRAVIIGTKALGCAEGWHRDFPTREQIELPHEPIVVPVQQYTEEVVPLAADF